MQQIYTLHSLPSHVVRCKHAHTQTYTPSRPLHHKPCAVEDGAVEDGVVEVRDELKGPVCIFCFQ